jgi:hypothetical protein
VKRVTRLYVAPYWYDVTYDSLLSSVAGVLGACGTDDLKILMQANNPPDVMIETLLHESMHAMWAQTNLLKTFSSDEQEAIIYAMTPRIMAFLRDNPEFARALCRKQV